MRRFHVGQAVELSANGRRMLKRREPRGWVLAVAAHPASVKVVFLEQEWDTAEWWPSDWFVVDSARPDLNGVREAA